ncbi:MAG: OB-fold nucleic acid binding domain-containing protein [Candidatus Nanoarchaeia archaeon]|nr:OB-fold nucleic acid binding domain-containing protein [Candidatus Nanoarchaeia archaeon]
MPYNEILEKIRQKSGLSEQEIKDKIDAKLKQLSGLISKEGAAHILANELGIKLFDSLGGKLQIKNILSGMRSVEVVGRVTRVFELREFNSNGRQGKVASMIIGDETGTIRVVMWGEQADRINEIKEGDIVRIISGYVRENRNKEKEIHMNNMGKIVVNPEGVTVKEVKQTTTSNRKKIKDLTEDDSNAEILGTIVQVFDPRFFEVCPECGKRARNDGEGFLCETHGNVTPSYSFVLNIFLDDGTDNIRAVFFRDQALKLLNKTQEQMVEYKDNPEKFEDIKTELLGNIIKIVGRTTKNEMFNRIEIVSQMVFINPNPEEEIKKLNKELESVKEENVE